MEEITIVHLSDTHLGTDYILRGLRRRRPFWKTEDKTLLENLGKALREVKPDFVIHTGDVVNKSTAKNFTNAAKTLRAIFADAGSDIRTRVLMILGTHDARIL